MEFFFGLKRSRISGHSRILFCILASMLRKHLCNIYNNDRTAMILKAARVVFFIPFAAGWTATHSATFALLKMNLEYGNDIDNQGVNRLILSTIMYALRLWHQKRNENNSLLHEQVDRPMLPPQVKQIGGCSKCSQQFKDCKRILSHPSGYVYCDSCIDLTADEVKCLQTGMTCAKRHVRQLRL